MMLANSITMIESVIDMAHSGRWPNFYRKTSIEWLFVKVALWKLISDALYENLLRLYDSTNVSDGSSSTTTTNDNMLQQL